MDGGRMKETIFEVIEGVMLEEIEETKEIEKAHNEEEDPEIMEGCKLRINSINEALEVFRKEVRKESLYITIREAIEQEQREKDEWWEKYKYLKFGVEFDRQSLKIDEAASLNSEEAKELKLSNDKKREAYLSEKFKEERKALFNKRGNRENAHLRAKQSEGWYKYYLAVYEQEGDIEVKDRLWDEKNKIEKEEE